MANTGRIEYEEEDRNPQSRTFGQKRWVDGGVDVDACPLPTTYYSALIQEAVTKNNCPSGQFGSTVQVTSAAGSFTSTISQMDADTQARTAFDAGKQAYANQNGICSSSPGGTIVWLPQYEAVGCFACTMVNQDDSSDVRAATSNEIAQYTRATDNNNSPCQACTQA